MFRIRVLLKQLLSYRKRDWSFEDYPVGLKFMDHGAAADASSSLNLPPDFTPVPWFAFIAGWLFMFGFGQTSQEALDDLRRNFERFKASGQPLPRPGTSFFPSQEGHTVKTRQHAGLAAEFIEKVFGLDPGSTLISDGSSLHDFTVLGPTVEEYQRKITLLYRVPVSDIEDGNLARIFERIQAKREAENG